MKRSVKYIFLIFIFIFNIKQTYALNIKVKDINVIEKSNSDDINIDNFKVILNLVNKKSVKESTEVNLTTLDNITSYICNINIIHYFCTSIMKSKGKAYILQLVIIPVVMCAKLVLTYDIYFY